jgi:hypothetical protein
MIVYKFRRASQVDYTFDILLNRRLHCADWTRLNDPMEGRFQYPELGLDETSPEGKYLSEVIDEKHRWKVCSLARVVDSRLMWAHYAEDFKGMAIEVELPDNDENIKDVEYADNIPVVLSRDDQATAVQRMLFTKFVDWSYEREVRIRSRQEFYHVGDGIRRVIFGDRTNRALRRAVELVCQNEHIPCCGSVINNSGIRLVGH